MNNRYGKTAAEDISNRKKRDLQVFCYSGRRFVEFTGFKSRFILTYAC